jgi:ribosome recycling factor
VDVIKETIKDAESRMKGAVHNLEEDLAGVRTGRANPALVEKIEVDYYGAPTQLNQLATINIPEPRQILIRPFDAATIKGIERAIIASDLGIMPNNDGKVIRLNLPPLNEERRRDLVKLTNARLEEARISCRNVRRDIIKDLKEYEKEKLISEDDLKRAEEELQKVIELTIAEIDRVGERKNAEIMEV